jgi:UDP-2,3-diacylglucosamine pyrophosphatase LpxH
MTAAQSGAVTTVRIDYSGGNTEHLLFLASDLHVDSVACNREVLLGDLAEASSRGAMIFLFGDTFDAMQGRFDPRRSLDELRPEYRRNDYYDFVVKDVARILSPFAKNIVLISDGNHETSTLKNSNISLTDRLIWTLNTQYGGNVMNG